jgi:hypothetical protein
MMPGLGGSVSAFGPGVLEMGLEQFVLFKGVDDLKINVQCEVPAM